MVLAERPLALAAIGRHPVKSMLGESLEAAAIGSRGLVGDRTYAVVDRGDGRIASAKHPAKWKRLLEIAAAYVDEVTDDRPVPVRLTFPDGTTLRSDDTGVDAALSRFVEREVALTTVPPDQGVYEEVWPDLEGLAPAEFIDATTTGTLTSGEPVSDIPVGAASPAGTFFDLAPLHLLTTATLAALRAAGPGADFDHRRYRPNLVIDVPGEEFVENGWVGREVRIGPTCVVRIDLPTMRCVMTTLAHGEVGADRETLRVIARTNRLEIPGLGSWACAGAYGSPTTAGTVTVGDPVELA